MMESPNTPHAIKKWSIIRQKGMIRFILLEWTLVRSGLFFLFMLSAHRWDGIPFTLHAVLIFALICAITGIAAGSLKWITSERRYQKFTTDESKA
jgi:hypothetical protein